MTCPEIITRTYSVTDLCGGQIFVTQTITVEDITAPVFAAAPAAVTVACAADVPAMTNLGYTDNCDPTGSVAGTDVSNGGTCPEIITRTWTFTDACGNTSSTTQTITVHDLVAPVFAAAPAAVTVACAADVPAMTNLAYTDNCDAAGSVAGTDVSNGGTCPEIITRTWTITDACGNTTSTTQTITVHDLVAPVFAAAPAAVTVSCIADVPAMTSLGYTDNCDAAGTVAGTDGALVGGACGGTITRTWTITDACGNTTTTTQTITVDDNTNPTASNPATTTVPGGPAPAVDPLVVIDEADNCSVPVVAFVSESNDGAACPLTITRIYSVTDACGNTINVTHTILITDPFPPTASNPAPVAVECIGDVPAPDVTVVTDEADNQGVPTVAFVSDVSNGMTCPEIITRTYSVTDVCNNMITVTQTITVDDITAPTATAPATVNVECIGDVPAANIAVITDEADNCTAAPIVAHVGDVSNGLSCPETITRTYSITDNCGNVTTVAQTIIVDDVTAPTGTAPATVNVECIGDVPAANIALITNEADNCTAAPLVAHVGDVSDGLSCPETITRTYSITDNCGNVTTVTQSIIVNDVTDPTASNPVTVAVQLPSQVPAPDVTVVTTEADNCTAAPVVAWVSDVSDGLSCPETITRTYSVTDNCNNSITVVQTITVSDLTAPTASNPVAVNVECIGDVPAFDVTVVTNEADNSGIAPTVAFVGDVSNGLSCPETITRTYSVTDNCNNSILVTQTIVVNDITAPTATAPAAVTVECIGDVPAPNTALITNEADNCTVTPVVTFVSDVSDGNTCPETITRTYRITDDCNNTTNVTQTIIVNDITAPTANTPAAISVECIGDVPAAVPLSGIGTVVTGVSDNCTVAPIVAHVGDVSDGNTCPETITRTYSITDDCGNVTTVAQTIIVNDITAPTASNPIAISVPGSMDVPAPDVTVVTTEADNCTANPVVAWVSDVSDGNICNLEKITRTYSITDDCGNQTLVTQLITILAVYPTVNAGIDQTVCDGETVTVNASVNPASSTISWTAPVIDGVGFIPSPGTNVYTVSANNLGCISTDNVSVIVSPNPAVSFNANVVSGCEPLEVVFTNTTVSAAPIGSCVWDFGNGVTSNICGPVTYTYQNPGAYDVTLTTTDGNGCVGTTTYANYIYVEAIPVANFTASAYELSNIETSSEVEFTNQSIGASSYFWSFGDGGTSTVEDPTHYYETINAGGIEIMLVAVSDLGCVDTTYQFISISEELIYYVPNTFTPDGDAFNNTFQPVFTSGFDPYNFTMLIFNRWGEIVFETHNAEIGWDGTYGGKYVQDGTYTWKIEFKSRVNDKKYVDVGHVNMLR
jgi:gliding motility-associated-like protein